MWGICFQLEGRKKIKKKNYMHIQFYYHLPLLCSESSSRGRVCSGHLVPMFKGPSSTDLAAGLALLTDPSPHGLPPFPRLLQSSQSPCPPFPCLVLPSGGPGSENRASDGSGKVGPLPLQPSYFQEHPYHVVAHVSHCDLASGPASCLLSAPHHAAGGKRKESAVLPSPT